MADNIDGFTPITIDPIATVDSYLEKKTWRIKENSTSNYSIGGLILHEAGTIAAQYWLNKVYSDDIKNAHKSCDFHIHDLQLLAAYCFDKEKEFLLSNGKFLSFEEAEKRGITKANILSFNQKTKLFEDKEATDIGKRGIDDLYQIDLEDGTVLKGFTRWHRFLTSNRGYVRADELTDEDNIIEYTN